MSNALGTEAFVKITLKLGKCFHHTAAHIQIGIINA